VVEEEGCGCPKVNAPPLGFIPVGCLDEGGVFGMVKEKDIIRERGRQLNYYLPLWLFQLSILPEP
jgi:hypothetical protein